jgi:hypothetical protein
VDANGAVLVAARAALDRARRGSVAAMTKPLTAMTAIPVDMFVVSYIGKTPVVCTLCGMGITEPDYATSSYATPDGVFEEPMCSECVDRIEDEAEAMRKKNGW